MHYFNRYRTFAMSILVISVFLTGSWLVHAEESGELRSEFFFDNHIDTHQSTKLKVQYGQPVSLKGKLYIIFTGENDSVSGLPIARHPRGASENEECGVDVSCVAGWKIEAVPGEAKFLSHSGVNGDDHAVWMVNRVDIPQPGSFTHFHWISEESTDPRAPYVSPECDKVNAGQLETQDPSAVDQICLGWFLQLKAVKSFAFEHGGEKIPVRPGIDNSTHLNLVTNYKADLVITPTR